MRIERVLMLVAEFHLPLAGIEKMLLITLDLRTRNKSMVVMMMMINERMFVLFEREQYLLVLLETVGFPYLVRYVVKEFVHRLKFEVLVVQAMFFDNYITNWAVTFSHLDRNNIDWVFVG